ncbi:putative defense protein 3 [Clavelina lepadiformis]|uniref:putative defense protein 3 n=1 Tax=Clavelina lepadiformis TaxID=159417 RepID=UPI004041DBB6
MSYLYLVAFVSFTCVHTSLGLPNGAPTGVCTTMTPRHVNSSTNEVIQAQTATRYSVVTMASNYSAGDVVRVWIADNQSTGYRGILLQARNLNGSSALGRWRTPPTNTKLITCSSTDDAVTHSNTELKTNTHRFDWEASENYGDLQFVATVAENHDVFWVQLKSSTVTGEACHLIFSKYYLLLTTFAPLMFTMLH